MIENPALLVFPLLVIIAALSDLLTMRIPNWISSALIIGFVVLGLLMGMTWQMASAHLMTGVLALAVCFGLFSGGFLGGGDAKLIAAVSLWIGWTNAASFILATALFGGILAMMILSCRRFPLPASLMSQAWIQRIALGPGAIPYGIAIAMGALVVYPNTVWVHLAG